MPRERCPAALLLIASAACSPSRVSIAALADSDAPPTVFELIAEQTYELPDDTPDELLTVPSSYYAHETISLREGNVISAWITTASPEDAPAVMTYRCVRDASGRHRWAGAPEAYLTPLGVDVTEEPDLLPFTATHTLVTAPGPVFGAMAELGFTIEAPARGAESVAFAARAGSQLAGVVDATLPAEDDDLPIARLRKTHGLRLGMYQAGSFEHADYVLRLHATGGAGPGAGTVCAPGEPPQRVPFSAEYWFVHVPFIRIEHDEEPSGG